MSQENSIDLIVIGAGPAGLTAAQYGSRANLRVTVVEQMAPGGQVLLIDNLENYPGLPSIPGYSFAETIRKQAEDFGASFVSDTVMAVKKEGPDFILTLGSGKTLQAPALIAATGAVHRNLDVPGEKELTGRGVSYCATCDGPFFKGKTMFVVGGGDAACDEAMYLSHLTERVIMFHRRDRFRAQKALAERVLQNKNIEVRFNSRILEIRGEQKLSSVLVERTDTKEQYEEAGEAIFIFAGTIPQGDYLKDLGVERDESGYILTNQAMETAVPGLYAAGDLRATAFRQVVVACGEGAVAAHRASAYIDELRGQAYR